MTREEAIQRLKANRDAMYFPETIEALDMAIEALTNVQNMHKGKWIDRSEGGKIRNPWWESHKCDQCGYVGSGVWRFCPNCGARMKGGDYE